MKNYNHVPLAVIDCSGEFLKTDFDDLFVPLTKIFLEQKLGRGTNVLKMTEILKEHQCEGIEYDLLLRGITFLNDGLSPVHIRTMMDFEILKNLFSSPNPSDIIIMKMLIVRETVIALQQGELYILEDFGRCFCSIYSELFSNELWSKLNYF